MKINKSLIFALSLSTLSDARIYERFPVYSMVFTTFGINHNYINNAEFQQFVNQNEQEFRRVFTIAVNRGSLIIPTIKEMLIEKGLSPMFLYLCMVESSFKPEAISRSQAKGLWQFKEEAGKDQKLIMNHQIDERLDPIRGTEAAIGYLTTLNRDFNKWYLAAMSYNSGKTNVDRAVQCAGTTDLNVLLDPTKNYIRPEARKYIHKILLFAMIGENYIYTKKDNFGRMMPTTNSDKLVPVRVRTGESLLKIASVLNMDPYLLKRTNLHLLHGVVPNQQVRVNIPESRLTIFKNNYR